MLQGQVSRESGDTLNFRTRVRLGIPGSSITVILLPLAEIDATGQLADDIKVGTATDFGFEGRNIDEGFGGEVTGSQVAICAQLFAEGEDALFRTDLACAPFWTTDCAEEDCVCGFGCRKSCVCKGLPGCVDRTLDGLTGRKGRKKVSGRRGTYAAEEMFLEVELSSTWTFCFNYLEDLFLVRYRPIVA